MLVFYVAAYSITLLRHGWNRCEDHNGEECSFWSSFEAMAKRYPVTMAVISFEALIFWFPVALLLFHLYIASTGQTTYEILRSREVNTHEAEMSSPDQFMPELRPFRFASPYSLGMCGNLWSACIQVPGRSNVHIHHQPPTIERVNEAIVNKRTIVFLKPDEVLQSLGKHQSEQQGLLNEERKSNGCHIEEEEPPTKGIHDGNVEIEMQEPRKEEDINQNASSMSRRSNSSKPNAPLTIRRAH